MLLDPSLMLLPKDIIENAQDIFDSSPSGKGDGFHCSKCGTRFTEPCPGCSCRVEYGYHVMKYHHRCVTGTERAGIVDKVLL